MQVVNMCAADWWSDLVASELRKTQPGLQLSPRQGDIQAVCSPITLTRRTGRSYLYVCIRIVLLLPDYEHPENSVTRFTNTLAHDASQRPRV